MEEKDIHKDLPEIDLLTNDKFVPHHEFDGIRELANNPPWWLTFIFIFTIMWGYVYFAKYHIYKDAPLQEEEYAQEMAALVAEEEVTTLADASGPIVEVDMTIPLVDEAGLAKGAKIFSSNCVVCHLAQGQGSIGPNLTDDYWLHGGSFGDIQKTITNGVVEKGMISWKTQLSAVQIHQVASYVTTLHGTNPPNPKAPQGEKYVAK